MNETILGKITSVKFGVIDGRFGLFLVLSGSWAVCTSDVTWDPTTVEVGEYTQWTEEDRTIQLADICRKVSKLLSEAKVTDVSHLLNKPVEFIAEKGMLKSWRILTEVL